LLYFWTNAQQYIGKNVRLPKKNVVGNVSEFGLNLIPKIFSALARNFLSNQKYEDEIWQKKKRRKIVLILPSLNCAS
jgi:hypothetical protein